MSFMRKRVKVYFMCMYVGGILYIYSHIYTHTYIHIYIHTNTHTHTFFFKIYLEMFHVRTLYVSSKDKTEENKNRFQISPYIQGYSNQNFNTVCLHTLGE